MNSPLPFDELNALKEKLTDKFVDGRLSPSGGREDIIDEMLDLFLLAAANGSAAANDDLGTDYHLDIKRVTGIVDREIEGKTWRDRVNEYFDNGGTVGDIIRIAETETNRDTNEAGYATATEAGAKKKTWHCMMLPTSRDSHIYLNGVSAPIDGEFFSINGGSTQYPCEWGIPEEDVNCLCWLTYSK